MNHEETDEDMRFMLARALVRDLRVNHVEARNMVNHWQDEVRAEAWEEGHEAAAMRVPEGVWHDVAAPRPANPYRQETDA